MNASVSLSVLCVLDNASVNVATVHCEMEPDLLVDRAIDGLDDCVGVRVSTVYDGDTSTVFDDCCVNETFLLIVSVSSCEELFEMGNVKECEAA